MEKAKTIKKINVTGTLQNMAVGSKAEFNTASVDAQVVRSVATRLKTTGVYSVNKTGSKIIVSRLS